MQEIKKLYEIQHEETLANILDSAQRVLIDNGFYKTTMATIAKEAHISRQRLYLYFNSLDSIIFNIQIRNLRVFVDSVKKELDYEASNSTDKLDHLINSILRYSDRHRPEFLFTNEFDSFYRNKALTKKMKEEYKSVYCDSLMLAKAILIIEDGKRNKEFRQDIDSQRAIPFWLNLTQVFGERLAIFATNGEKHCKEELGCLKEQFREAVYRYFKA